MPGNICIGKNPDSPSAQWFCFTSGVYSFASLEKIAKSETALMTFPTPEMAREFMSGPEKSKFSPETQICAVSFGVNSMAIVLFPT